MYRRRRVHKHEEGDERTRARRKALVLLTGMDRTERQLREKLEKDPNHPEFIKTIWGTGYVLEL